MKKVIMKNFGARALPRARTGIILCHIGTDKNAFRMTYVTEYSIGAHVKMRERQTFFRITFVIQFCIF